MNQKLASIWMQRQCVDHISLLCEKEQKKTLKNDVTFLLNRAKNGLVAGKKRASLIKKKNDAK